LAESRTIADFLGKLPGTDQTRGHLPVHRGDVLVVDEATQVPTADLAAIQAVADRAGARIIPAGDTEQLTSPEAGGMMGQVARDHGYARVHEVRRFAEPWEGPASLRLRDGDQGVIADYKRHGRIREGARMTCGPARCGCGSATTWRARNLCWSRPGTPRPQTSRTTCGAS
jgi:hypothetical protein